MILENQELVGILQKNTPEKKKKKKGTDLFYLRG